MSEGGPDLTLETDGEKMETKDGDQVLSAEKEDSRPKKQEWTLEASIRATKSLPSKESLKAFIDGLRERAYNRERVIGSSMSVSRHEANMLVRELKK